MSISTFLPLLRIQIKLIYTLHRNISREVINGKTLIMQNGIGSTNIYPNVHFLKVDVY